MIQERSYCGYRIYRHIGDDSVVTRRCLVKVLQCDGTGYELPCSAGPLWGPLIGFEWGYVGVGPMQLSYDLCVHMLASPQDAKSLCRGLCSVWTSRLAYDGWSISYRDFRALLRTVKSAYDF